MLGCWGSWRRVCEAPWLYVTCHSCGFQLDWWRGLEMQLHFVSVQINVFVAVLWHSWWNRPHPSTRSPNSLISGSDALSLLFTGLLSLQIVICTVDVSFKALRNRWWSRNCPLPLLGTECQSYYLRSLAFDKSPDLFEMSQILICPSEAIKTNGGTLISSLLFACSRSQCRVVQWPWGTTLGITWRFSQTLDGMLWRNGENAMDFKDKYLGLWSLSLT